MSLWSVLLIAAVGVYDLWAIILILVISDLPQRIRWGSLVGQVPFWVLQPWFFLFPDILGIDVALQLMGGVAVLLAGIHLPFKSLTWRLGGSLIAILGAVLLIQAGIGLLAFPGGIPISYWSSSTFDILLPVLGGFLGILLYQGLQLRDRETLVQF